MEKTVIEYDIPIQSEEGCKEYNEMCKKIYKNNFTPIRSTEEHIKILINKLYKAVQEVGDDGGWYVGDGIKVKIELEYDPENK